MSKKIWSLVIIFSLVLIFTVNWSYIKKYTNRSQQKSEFTLLLGYSNWSGWWPWAIAQEKGLFEKNGINVDLVWYDNYSESVKDLASGYIDANSQRLSDTLTQRSVKELNIVLVNDYSIGNDKIIVSQNINNVKDLENKNIALEEGTAGDLLLSLMLKKDNINKDNINIFNIETGAAIAAFISKRVEAVITFSPFWLDALKCQGAKEIASSADFPNTIIDILAVNKSILNKHPKQIQALVDTWFDVLNFIQENPVIADEIIAKKINISYDILQLFKNGTYILNLNDNIETFKKGNNLKHINFAAKQINLLLKDNNFDSQYDDQDIDKLFDSTFINNVN